MLRQAQMKIVGAADVGAAAVLEDVNIMGGLLEDVEFMYSRGWCVGEQDRPRDGSTRALGRPACVVGGGRRRCAVGTQA